MTGGISRRRFLLLGAVLLAEGGLPAGAAGQGGLPLMQLLQGVGAEPGPLGFYAERWLAAHPRERDPAELKRLLFADVRAGGLEELRRRLSEKVREDFEAGRTANLDGWILAVTEVRLWCLYFLLTG